MHHNLQAQSCSLAGGHNGLPCPAPVDCVYDGGTMQISSKITLHTLVAYQSRTGDDINALDFMVPAISAQLQHRSRHHKIDEIYIAVYQM